MYMYNALHFRVNIHSNVGEMWSHRVSSSRSHPTSGCHGKSGTTSLSWRCIVLAPRIRPARSNLLQAEATLDNRRLQDEEKKHKIPMLLLQMPSTLTAVLGVFTCVLHERIYFALTLEVHLLEVERGAV